MTKLRGILSKSPNVADFLHLDINEVQARCLLITQQVGKPPRGQILKIQGSVYTIQSESTGYQNLGNTTTVSKMKIYVGQQTRKLTK